MKRSLMLLAFMAFVAGCKETQPKIHCSDNAQCSLPGRSGVCIEGSCAISDSSCPSGRRYDTTSGASGDCVPPAMPDAADPADMAMVDPPDFATLPNADLSQPPPPPTLSFGTATKMAVAPNSYARAIIAADFNKDGKLDVAATAQNNYISVFMNNGTGLNQANSIGSDLAPTGLVAADVTEDGKLDIVYIAGNGLSVMTGDGSGGFTNGARIKAGANPHFIAVADFNHDNHLDVATANDSGKNSQIAVLMGVGGGAFSGPQIFGAKATWPKKVAIGDLNNDGKPDLLLSSAWGTGGNVAVLTNNNGTSFADPTFYNPPGGAPDPEYITVGDVDGDRKDDLIVSDYATRQLVVYLSSTSFMPKTLNTGKGPGNPVIADVNADGVVDLVVGVAGAAQVFLGKGGGNFEDYFGIGAGSTNVDVVVGDFTGDGLVDLMTASELEGCYFIKNTTH